MANKAGTVSVKGVRDDSAYSPPCEVCTPSATRGQTRAAWVCPECCMPFCDRHRKTLIIEGGKTKMRCPYCKAVSWLENFNAANVMTVGEMREAGALDE